MSTDETGPQAPTSPRDTTSDPPDAQADNITTRGWDGWPTSPTPDYLVPAMGKIPVASTQHFQTVTMSALEDNLAVDELWYRLRAPLIRALRERAAGAIPELRVQAAQYGDLNPGNFIDVRDKVIEQVENGTLSLTVGSELFGDPAPGEPKRLDVGYRVAGLSTELWGAGAEENTTLRLPDDLVIDRAVFGHLASGETADVTAAVRAAVRGNRLSIEASAAVLGDPGEEHRTRELSVEYTIWMASATHRVYENETMNLPLGLEIVEASYGVMPGVRADVTDLVRNRIEDNRLRIEVSDALDGEIARERARALVVYYTIGTERGTLAVPDGEVLEIASPRETFTPDAVYRRFFADDFASLSTLAERFERAGLAPRDLWPPGEGPDDEFLTMREAIERLMDLDPLAPLDPVAHARADAMTRPAEGAILYHEQGWYGRGLALGNLLHSVALAPGEVTQVAMTHWNHRTRASDRETVSQADRTTEDSLRNRAVADIQRSALHAHTAGGTDTESSAVSTAAATSSVDAKASFNIFSGLKGSLSGSSSSVGTAHNVSSVSSHNDGDKNLSMSANQSVNATTERQAEAVRTRRASVVREVAQGEDETLTTRVVANYNHMHALSVMYFEVLEVYSLRTRVVDAERVIFLPYTVRDVRELVPRHRARLIDAARAVERPDLADAIARYDESGSAVADLQREIDALTPVESEEGQPDTPLSRLHGRVRKLERRIDALPDTLRTALGTVRSALGEVESKRSEILREIAAVHTLPSVFSNLLAERLQSQLRPLDAEVENHQRQIRDLERAVDARRAALERERAIAVERVAELGRRRAHLEAVKRHLDALVAPGARGPFHDNRLYFNQYVWLGLSPGEVLGLARRLDRFKGERLGTSVDPTPVAVSGNLVGYRWRIADLDERDTFKRQYVTPFVGDPEKELATVSADVSVPTGGVFAEAVLGQGVAAEKIDLSRFWNWQDSMIPILPTGIESLKASTPTVQELDPTPQQLDESAARLGPLQDLPAPESFAALAQTMQAQVFRDMSGQELLKSLAEATTQAASSGEQHAADVASRNLQAGLDFVSDMASKALSAAAASETGGASLLGGLSKGRGGGGASLLGGVLNAEGAGGGKLFSRMSGTGGAFEASVARRAFGERESGDADATGDDDTPDTPEKTEDASGPSGVSPGMLEPKPEGGGS